MTGKNIKIGIIGAGKMGSRWADIVSKNKDTNLTVIIDTNNASGLNLSKKYSAKYYQDLKSILESDIPDAFLVITPHRFLSDYAREILTMNKHVFIEKPGASSAKDMKSIIGLAKRKKRILMVGFNYRFFDAISRAYNIVKKGEIGKLLSIRIKHGHAGRPGYENEWRMNKKMAGGGVLMDQGVHLIDLALWFFGSQKKGKIKFVSGVMSNLFLNTKVEDNAMVVLKHSNGSIASISVGVSEWQPVFQLEAICTLGLCRVDGVGRKYGGRELLTVTKHDSKAELSSKEFECNSDPDNSLRYELAEFINAIKGHRKPVPGGDDALNTLLVIGKIYSK
ncbi:MAG: Gfo/Idh/MocA family oxidoreductase [Minisyncoccia bacterium]